MFTVSMYSKYLQLVYTVSVYSQCIQSVFIFSVYSQCVQSVFTVSVYSIEIFYMIGILIRLFVSVYS